MTNHWPSAAEARPTAISPNEVLLYEMAPAMRRRVESDGKMFGLLVGLIVLLLAAFADFFVTSSRSPQTPTEVFLIGDLIRHSLLLMAAFVLFALPSVMKRLNLRRELAFRRQHGKWRWER